VTEVTSRSAGDRITVEFPATDGYRSVGRLVLGGLASRFELPVDRVEDLLLAVESLLVQEASDGAVTLDVTAAPAGLLVRIGPFAEPPLADPGVVRVVEALVDEVFEDRDEAGQARVELLVSAVWLRDGE
jgi:hypothetical protein